MPRDTRLSWLGFGPDVLHEFSGNSLAVKGREQQLIELNGGAKSIGGTSGNAINGISITNPRRLEYLGAAKEFG